MSYGYSVLRSPGGRYMRATPWASLGLTPPVLDALGRALDEDRASTVVLSRDGRHGLFQAVVYRPEGAPLVGRGSTVMAAYGRAIGQAPTETELRAIWGDR